MKHIFVLLAMVCITTAAKADLVMQQQVVTPSYDGVIIIKIKGAKVRMDMYAGQPRALSTIVDLDTGETITLLHTQKLFLKTPGKPMNHPRSAGTPSQIPVPRDTGKNQKVGDFDTELYTWSNARGITGTAWVAKNYPDFARIRTDIAMLDKTTTTDNDTTPEISLLPGMVVRSQVAGGGQTITLALISAKEGPLDASLFGVPRDYKELPKPKLLKPVPAPPASPVLPKPSGSSTPKAPATSTTPPTQKLPAW